MAARKSMSVGRFLFTYKVSLFIVIRPLFQYFIQYDIDDHNKYKQHQSDGEQHLSVQSGRKSGIVTAIVLGVGRAIGEAMAITLVSGSSVNVPLPFNSVRFLTTAIVSEMGYSSGLHRQVLFTIGLVLFVFIMIINIVLNKILKKGADDNE
jgi:ABC-type tungstate transport system substrate-binding protein